MATPVDSVVDTTTKAQEVTVKAEGSDPGSSEEEEDTVVASVPPPPPGSPVPTTPTTKKRAKSTSYYICVSRKKPIEMEEEIEIFKDAVKDIFGKYGELTQERFFTVDDVDGLIAMKTSTEVESGKISDKVHLHILINVSHRTSVVFEEDELRIVLEESLGPVFFSHYEIGAKLTMDKAIEKRGKLVLTKEMKETGVKKPTVKQPVARREKEAPQKSIPDPSPVARTSAPQAKVAPPQKLKPTNSQLLCFGILE